MARRSAQRKFGFLLLCGGLLSARSVRAAAYRGQITSGGLAVPGATIVATHAGATITTVSDEAGRFAFADLASGPWHIHVEMLCFVPQDSDVLIAPDQPAATWQLTMLPLPQALALTKSGAVLAPRPSLPSVAADAGKAIQAPTSETPRAPEDDSQRPSDGLLAIVSNA